MIAGKQSGFYLDGLFVLRREPGDVMGIARLLNSSNLTI